MTLAFSVISIDAIEFPKLNNDDIILGYWDQKIEGEFRWILTFQNH